MELPWVSVKRFSMRIAFVFVVVESAHATADRRFHEFRQRRVDWVDEIRRPAAAVGESGRFGIDADVAIKRRENFLEVDGPFGGELAEFVRRTDDLPGTDAPAC